MLNIERQVNLLLGAAVSQLIECPHFICFTALVNKILAAICPKKTVYFGIKKEKEKNCFQGFERGKGDLARLILLYSDVQTYKFAC